MRDQIIELFKPLVGLIVQEIYPYIYLSLVFVILGFLLILGIFYLLLRSHIKDVYLKNFF
jgi:positive regulator of sigma E activity